METKQKRHTRTWIGILLVLISVCIIVVTLINSFICLSTSFRIVSLEEVASLTDFDTILVLGCGVKPDGTPSDMLRDRLDACYDLYEQGHFSLVLMSGDHQNEDYDEVGAMQSYAMDKGIPNIVIKCDPMGLSTYESLYRAKYEYGLSKIFIVSQTYHLYRALYIAHSLGLEAYGISADYHAYQFQAFREFREIAARIKDFFQCFSTQK